MLLFDVMRSAECSICLQTLLHSEKPSALPPRSEPQEKKSSCLLQLLAPWRSEDRENVTEEGGFQITFAPGISQRTPADDVLTFIDALDMYNRTKKKRKGQCSSCDTVDYGPSSSVSDQCILVLPCGHMLHFLCAIQLYEYSKKASCPICRQELKSQADSVVFAPRPRPTVTQRDGLVNSDEITHESGDGSGEEDVRFAGMCCMAPTDAYKRRLQHETCELKQRGRNLRSREHDLTSSRDRLEEQCLSLELSADEARRRYAVLTQQGKVGVERLIELRDVARRTHMLINQLTSELASLTRQQVGLDHQLEKNNQKLQQSRLNKQSNHVDMKDRAKAEKDGFSPPLKKKRLRDFVSGVSLSYHVSDK